MGKIRQWIERWFDYHIERSMQRKADKQWKNRKKQ
jgi:hypothetical protein